MKRIASYLGITTVLVASCSVKEENFETPKQDDVIYYASFEQPAEEETRVYANEDLLLRWTTDDRVSIFDKNTLNQQYKFLGETGDNAGEFGKVSSESIVAGNEIPHIVSVYPYQDGTKISEDEVISVMLPAEQHYAENSFGLGANTMVSVSADYFLQFKNVGGYLMLKLYGDGVSVSSITLRGNNGEKLAGKATVTMPLGGTPSAVMADDATTTITLTCEAPVQLGASAEESTQFWFVVPPVKFSKGFQITVSGNGGVFHNSTEKTVTIERNKLSKMSPIEVELSQPKNVVYYTSSDGTVVTPHYPDAFGASILSNEYINGHGIITFDGDLTSIGDYAFGDCPSLASITIPASVTSIGNGVFWGCDSLTSITIPASVTSIGEYAFRYCYSLTSIAIPNSVTSIGDGAFNDCTSLTSITLPEGVTSIGNYVFSGCSSLTSITIPNSVTSIGVDAFGGCTNLTSVRIPESVTSIGKSAFACCPSLTSIVIPDSVTSIGDGAFEGCTNLTSFTIPDSVTSIGYGVFGECSSLMSFSGKYSSPDGLFLIDSGSIIAIASGAIDGDVVIPDSVTSIGNRAFGGCMNLTSVTIPESVTSIGDYAFARCPRLTSITIPSSVTSIGEGAFCYSSLTSITIPESVTNIGDEAFRNCAGLISITIPASVTRIGDFVFAYCSSLTSITILEGVTSIGKYAFAYCPSLTSITIPGCVTSIGEDAFDNCTSLTSITIPESVTNIGDEAFAHCTSLTSITIKPDVPPIGGRNMFFNTNNAPIYVPSRSIEAYKSAQYWSYYADRIQAIPSSSVPVPEAVDLGLSVKWASFNLGAAKPEEYGDYYAWGETEPYYSSLDPLTWKEGKDAGYDWATYEWCMGSYTTMIKYCPNSTYGYNGFTDDKTVLDQEDDAAHVNLGGNWRMPTDAEWTELRENCTWEWVTQNGVTGRLVTANNGNSIFLPAAGIRADLSLKYEDSYGYYCSSSLNTEYPNCAWGVFFYSVYASRNSIGRYDGQSIRPVYAE